MGSNIVRSQLIYNPDATGVNIHIFTVCRGVYPFSWIFRANPILRASVGKRPGARFQPCGSHTTCVGPTECFYRVLRKRGSGQREALAVLLCTSSKLVR